MDDKFVELCKVGKLDEVKEMYQKYNINIHADNDVAFRWSCYNDHINIAQWLYSLGGVNPNANYGEAFRFSCRFGYLNMAQWLYSLGCININIEGLQVFIQSCYYEQLHVAQWLYSLGGIDIHANNDCVFIVSCYFYNIKMVKWLLSIDKFNNELVDKNLSVKLYDYAFSLGYLPTNKMIPFYAKYKNKIRNEIIENGNINLFELSYLVDIILVYI